MEAVATEVPGTRSQTNRWVVLVLVCIAQFMVILDATIVNVALPSIQHGLHFSASSLQWIVNAYTLIFGGFLLLGGRASDLLGRQRLFVAGIVVFTGASLLNAVATSSGMLIGGRALQGLGAALVSPAALSIITTTFEEGAERTKALGVWSAIAAGGGAVGLVLGGLLTETLSWRWVFFINLPIGIAAALLSLRLIPNSKAEDEPDTADVAGAVTVTGGLLVLVYGIVKAPAYGWASGRTIGLGVAALVLLAAFVVIELRSKAPLIRLGLLRLRSLSASNVARKIFSFIPIVSFEKSQHVTRRMRKKVPHKGAKIKRRHKVILSVLCVLFVPLCETSLALRAGVAVGRARRVRCGRRRVTLSHRSPARVCGRWPTLIPCRAVAW